MSSFVISYRLGCSTVCCMGPSTSTTPRTGMQGWRFAAELRRRGSYLFCSYSSDFINEIYRNVHDPGCNYGWIWRPRLRNHCCAWSREVLVEFLVEAAILRSKEELSDDLILSSARAQWWSYSAPISERNKRRHNTGLSSLSTHNETRSSSQSSHFDTSGLNTWYW